MGEVVPEGVGLPVDCRGHDLCDPGQRSRTAHW
jgi:hypothetical protein